MPIGTGVTIPNSSAASGFCTTFTQHNTSRGEHRTYVPTYLPTYAYDYLTCWDLERESPAGTGQMKKTSGGIDVCISKEERGGRAGEILLQEK